MKTFTSSGYKVSYDVRPSKQAERYIIIELLNQLQHVEVDIAEYHYAGMGSYFFYDFSLFHHLLGIKKLTSIEADETLTRRCVYNKPYDEISLVMDRSTNFLRAANSMEKYLFWMDYDFGFGDIAHDDLVTILAKFAVGTILFMTIDFDRPDVRPIDLLREVQEELPPELTNSLKPSDFSSERWKRTMIRLIHKTILEGLYGRRGVTFLRLFSFEYRDSRDMYSFGGVIADRSLRYRVGRRLRSWPFYCRNKLSNVIKIPQLVLTKKERGYLDKKSHSTLQYRGEIGISVESFEEYKKFYRYLPVYAEVS